MKKIKKMKAVLVLATAFLFTAASVPANSYSYSTAPQIVTVNSNALTNQTTNIVGDATLLYAGATSTVVDVTSFEQALDTAISSYADTVTINYTGATSLGALSTVLNNYIKEVMQLAGHDYEKISLYKWSFSYTNTSPQFTVTYSFQYLETPEQRAQVNQKVADVLTELGVSGMTEPKKEKAIHDYIVRSVAYDKTLVSHSAYAGLFNAQKTVCQGYALLAYKMFTAAGLQARIVTGFGNKVAHAWNYVQIDGAWYQVDLTWDDPVPDVIGRVRYDYYNLTDTLMSSKQHTWTAKYYPTATTQFVTTDADILSGGASSNMPTTALSPSDVVVVNNMIGKSDTVTVNGVAAGQIVKLFKTNVITTPLQSKTVAASTTSAAFTIAQLGIEAGSVYVTVTAPNKTESSRTQANFAEETKTAAPAGLVTENNVDATYKDTVSITGAKPKAILKAYTDASKKLTIGQATVADNGTAVIKMAATKFQSGGGNVFVTLKEVGSHESLPSSVAYVPEVMTVTPTAISIYNLTNIADVLMVKNLNVGDIVKVYTLETKGTVLTTGKVKTGKTSAAVNLKLNEQGGTVWVTVKSINNLESTRVKIDYTKED